MSFRDGQTLSVLLMESPLANRRLPPMAGWSKGHWRKDVAPIWGGRCNVFFFPVCLQQVKPGDEGQEKNYFPYALEESSRGIGGHYFLSSHLFEFLSEKQKCYKRLVGIQQNKRLLFTKHFVCWKELLWRRFLLVFRNDHWAGIPL